LPRFVSAADPGVWIEGEPHIVLSPAATAARREHAHLDEGGTLTLRLEGAASLKQALAIAEALE
jgi:hypothetical protein